MNTRPATVADLADLLDIDGTIESTHYAHIEQSASDGSLVWRMEWRRSRETAIVPGAMSDANAFALRQIVSGNDDGFVYVVEHDGRAIASILAQHDDDRNVLHVVDLRVDYDFRRNGIATVLMYQIIEQAKDVGRRAAYAETRANNAPAGRLLEKLGWELSGLDTKRQDNHDLVKEAATLLWYYVIR